MLVAQVVDVGQTFEIIDAGGGAKGPGSFVFQAAGSAPILGLVLDRKMTLVELRNTATGDCATEAGLIGQQVGLAVISNFLAWRP